MFGSRGGCSEGRDGPRPSRRALVRGAGALAGGLALSAAFPRRGGAAEATEVAAPAAEDVPQQAVPQADRGEPDAGQADPYVRVEADQPVWRNLGER